MAMTKVVSIKVPDDMAVLQSRLTATAKRAQIPVWELMSRMLDKWDESGSGEPTGEGWTEWRTAIEEKVRDLETELEAAKTQIDSGLLINQVNQNPLSAATEPAEPIKETQGEQEEDSLPVNQNKVKPVKASRKNKMSESIDSDIKAFEAAYAKLERFDHALIWQLREALDWSVERFDAVICQLRDSRRYQIMQGAETGKMTDNQKQSAFVDDNGFKHHTIMRWEVKAQKPMGELEPTPKVSPAPRKGKRTRQEKAPEPEELPAPRKRGRPKKAAEPTPRRRGRPPKKTV